MPYKNIVFVKLEKRLLNDPRWFGISEKAQLLYVKLLLGCAETYNNLPTDLLLLRRLLRIEWRKSCFESALREIEISFPKFKKDGNRYYFEEFETKTNYIREIPSVAQVLSKDGIDKDKEKDKEKEKKDIPTLWIRTFGRNPKLPEAEVTEQLIEKFGYDKVYQIFKDATLKGFKNINTLTEALDDKGKIKPRPNKFGVPEPPPQPKKEKYCHCGKEAVLWSGGVAGCSYAHILEAQKQKVKL